MAHLPFTTRARFRRKVDNLRAKLAEHGDLFGEGQGSTGGGGSSWEPGDRWIGNSIGWCSAPRRSRTSAGEGVMQSAHHLVNRLVGRQETGYRQFRRHERTMDGRVWAMSPLSERLLAAVEYPGARGRRQENYRRLHRLLARHNRFDAAPG
jgi:hypothetical protein